MKIALCGEKLLYGCIYQWSSPPRSILLLHLLDKCIFSEEIEVYSPITMAVLATLLPLLSGALTAYAQTCTTVQPVFGLPLDATSTAYASTVTTTSSVDCDGCSLEVTTFRAIILGSTVCHDLKHTYLSRLTNCS